MRGGALLAGAVAALACGAGAAARDQLGQRDPVVVQPHKSYIFYRTGDRLGLRLLREVSPADRSAWETARARALDRARAAFPGQLRYWQRRAVVCRGSHATACPDPEARPVEPNEENFAFPPPEMSNFLDVSAGPQFTRADRDYTYLMTVEPGTYTLYGQIVMTENGNFGICLCMGSVRFEARAGQIVDLGEIHSPIGEAMAAGQVVTPGISLLSSHAIVPPTSAMATPERLAGLPVVPADFRAADKMPNYFGVQISRLAPIPGVLAYERDRVIDLRAAGAR